MVERQLDRELLGVVLAGFPDYVSVVVPGYQLAHPQQISRSGPFRIISRCMVASFGWTTRLPRTLWRCRSVELVGASQSIFGTKLFIGETFRSGAQLRKFAHHSSGPMA